MSASPPTIDSLRIPRQPYAPRPARKSISLLLPFAALAGVAWFWWSRPRPIAVATATVTVARGGSADRTVLSASGYVTARRQATVSSKVTGRIEELRFEEGTRVQTGQILARIDATNVNASLELAQAQLTSAKLALVETKVRQREAEQELARQKMLTSDHFAAAADLDHAEAAFLAFRAHFAQQESDVAVAERAVGVWQQQLDDTVVRAPFPGVVISKNAQPGEIVSPLSAGGFTRTGICTIVDMDSLEIEIDVNESYINRVQPEQRVEATLDAYPDWSIPCRVIAVIPAADRQKATMRVRVGFEQLDPRILPDMSVKVNFREPGTTAANTDGMVFTVPANAIQTSGGKSVVFVVHGEHAERRAVALIEEDGADAHVRTGLAAGEKVVLNPPAGFVDGTLIQESNHE